jgi:hypothetical protein
LPYDWCRKDGVYHRNFQNAFEPQTPQEEKDMKTLQLEQIIMEMTRALIMFCKIGCFSGSDHQTMEGPHSDTQLPPGAGD